MFPASSLSKRPPPSPLLRHPENSRADGKGEPSKIEAVSAALKQTPDCENSLLTPVRIPEDPHGVLKESHPPLHRQLEMMNVLMGFEQANRYAIMDPHGNHIGYLAEQEHDIGSTFTRQMFRTHRSFTTHVFDRNEREILRISSRIRVYDAIGDNSSKRYTSSAALQGISAGSIVTKPLPRFLPSPFRKCASSVQQNKNGHPTSVTGRRRGFSAVSFSQFARADEPFLSWDFTLLSENKRLIGPVNRNFSGFAREIFTDTGFPMSGGAADAGGAANTGIEAAESAGAVGNAARGLGAGEGAIASAGPMAGYEVMQCARNNQRQDDASPAAIDPYEAQRSPQQGQPDQKNLQEEVWGESTWGNSNKNDSSPWSQGGGEGQGGCGEAGGLFDDFFSDS
ncbi:scramblase family [Cenococcum geophilum]